MTDMLQYSVTQPQIEATRRELAAAKQRYLLGHGAAKHVRTAWTEETSSPLPPETPTPAPAGAAAGPGHANGFRPGQSVEQLPSRWASLHRSPPVLAEVAAPSKAWQSPEAPDKRALELQRAESALQERHAIIENLLQRCEAQHNATRNMSTDARDLNNSYRMEQEAAIGKQLLVCVCVCVGVCVCVFLSVQFFSAPSLNDNHAFCCGLMSCFDRCLARLRSSVGSGFLVFFT